MSRTKRQRLESTVAAIQRQHGARALQKGSELPAQRRPPHVSTSFAGLDAITGCAGIPLGHVTLFTGPLGSGKLTVAYKVLMGAQQAVKKSKSAAPVAILSLNQQLHVDYIQRCAVDLTRLDFYQPPTLEQAVELLLYLAAGHVYRLILVDSVSDLLAMPPLARQFNRALSKLNRLLHATASGLLCIGEESAPWLARLLQWDQMAALRRATALHVDFGVQQWLDRDGQWRGYRRLATVRKSRWAAAGACAQIDIEFNGTVRAA